jgi:uncharacterized protein YdeI (YjbR/CyaY-like superfamily)
LTDEQGLLIQQTPNTQAARQLRFTTVAQIQDLAPVVTAYIQEAIQVETAGGQVAFKQTSDFALSAELQQSLAESPALRTAFHCLTPGRQRAYLLYFSAPQRAATRAARVAKCGPHILLGKGLKE